MDQTEKEVNSEWIETENYHLHAFLKHLALQLYLPYREYDVELL